LQVIEQTPFLNLVGQYPSAVEALKAIHSQKIDLIYLDIQMPDLSGMELARVIGKAPGHHVSFLPRHSGSLGSKVTK